MTSWNTSRAFKTLSVLLLSAVVASAEAPAPESLDKLPVFTQWRTYTQADGLPSDKVMSAQFDGDTIWAGTESGLAQITGGSVKRVYTVADGLPYNVISSLALCPRTGDLWVGTFGGLGRLSGGKITAFTQLNSGLINNVIHAVLVVDDEVWVATAAGTSVYNTQTQKWDLYDQTNTLMKEPWCYAVASNDTHVFLGVWGAGALEFDRATKHWKNYNDPDGEFEVDVFKNDGMLHDIVTSIGWGDGILWVGAYFGLSRYDGRHWMTFIDKDSPLPSDFVQNMRARGRWAWCCTDNGLAATDGFTWLLYQGHGEEKGKVVVTDPDGTERTVDTAGSLGHSFTFGVDLTDTQIAVGTAHGLSVASLATATAEPVAAGQ